MIKQKEIYGFELRAWVDRQCVSRGCVGCVDEPTADDRQFGRRYCQKADTDENGNCRNRIGRFNDEEIPWHEAPEEVPE